MPNPITGRPVPLRARPDRTQRFWKAVEEALSRIGRTCPEVLGGVEIGVDDVPSSSALFQGLTEHGVVPLAVAVDAEGDRPARIVVYRRPLEHRAVDDDDLRYIVHRTLVEQLAVLTGRSATDIDPEADSW